MPNLAAIDLPGHGWPMEEDTQQVARQGGRPALYPGGRRGRVGAQFAQALHLGLGKAAGLAQALDQLQPEQRGGQLVEQGLGFVNQLGLAL